MIAAKLYIKRGDNLHLPFLKIKQNKIPNFKHYNNIHIDKSKVTIGKRTSQQVTI